mmetsp:Transcript_49264/g.118452  ORF Transcript_49264/g.118452 Transcript_49264/m.118452 type:complete len:379 (-) Transcript_49264:686-1822(-)
MQRDHALRGGVSPRRGRRLHASTRGRRARLQRLRQTPRRRPRRAGQARGRAEEARAVREDARQGESRGDGDRAQGEVRARGSVGGGATKDDGAKGGADADDGGVPRQGGERGEGRGARGGGVERRLHRVRGRARADEGRGERVLEGGGETHQRGRRAADEEDDQGVPRGHLRGVGYALVRRRRRRRRRFRRRSVALGCQRRRRRRRGRGRRQARPADAVVRRADGDGDGDGFPGGAHRARGEEEEGCARASLLAQDGRQGEELDVVHVQRVQREGEDAGDAAQQQGEDGEVARRRPRRFLRRVGASLARPPRGREDDPEGGLPSEGLRVQGLAVRTGSRDEAHLEDARRAERFERDGRRGRRRVRRLFLHGDHRRGAG